METKQILAAISIVNLHAKTATQPQQLYFLKKRSLQKLIQEGKANKVGLQYTQNPLKSQQYVNTLVTCDCGEYFFHMKTTKDDLKTLTHVEQIKHKNPRVRMSVKQAREILRQYID